MKPLCFLAALLLIVIAFATTPRYRLVELQAPRGAVSYVVGLNDRGEAVGQLQQIYARWPAHWDVRGHLVALDAFWDQFDCGIAYDINNSGITIGFQEIYRLVSPFNNKLQGVVWQNGNAYPLATMLNPHFDLLNPASLAPGRISNSGIIAASEIVYGGYTGVARERPQAFPGWLFNTKNGNWQNINDLLPDDITLGKPTMVNGFSPDSHIRTLCTERGQSYLWEGQTFWEIKLDLKNGFYSPAGVNDSGTVAGVFTWDNMKFQSENPPLPMQRAFVWHRGGAEQGHFLLPPPDLSNATNIFAYGINNNCQIVGYCMRFCTNAWLDKTALLWENGQVYKLDDLIDAPGYHFFEANRINKNGVIACEATSPNGGHRACLLIPIKRR